MGKGRTTTGMVCAFLFLLQMSKAQGNPIPIDTPLTNWDEENPEIKYKSGNFKVVRQLLQHMENGPQVKREARKANDLFVFCPFVLIFLFLSFFFFSRWTLPLISVEL
jgi:hypothetical protein